MLRDEGGVSQGTGGDVVSLFESAGQISLLAEADLSDDFLDALAALEKGLYQLQMGRRQPEVGRHAEFGAEIAPKLAFGNLALTGKRRHAKVGRWARLAQSVMASRRLLMA